MTPIYHYSSGLARTILTGPGAFTVGPHIFCTEETVPPALMRHEECHVRQYARYGVIRFLVLYWWYQIRFGYKRNPLEVEARIAERTP